MGIFLKCIQRKLDVVCLLEFFLYQKDWNKYDRKTGGQKSKPYHIENTSISPYFKNVIGKASEYY